MRRRQIIALAAAGLVGLAGCSGDDGTDTYRGTDSPTDTGSGGPGGNDGTASPTSDIDESTPTETASQGVATVASQEFVVNEDDYSTQYAMTGEVTNTGEGRLSYVETTAKFHDENGDILGSNLTNMLDLAANETWEVWVPFFDAGEPVDGTLDLSDTSQFTTGRWPDGVTLQEHELQPAEDEYSGPTVEGRATNETGQTLDYLEARVKFFAENGNVIGSGFDNVTELGDGQTWRFTVEFTSYNEEWRDRVDSHAALLST